MTKKEQFNGFKRLTLKMEPLFTIERTARSLQTHYNTKASIEKSVSHTLFVKVNESRASELPSGRTLFVVNIPIDSTRECMEAVFKDQGIIEDIKWPKEILSGSSCHIIFKDSESIDQIMQLKSLKWKSPITESLSS